MPRPSAIDIGFKIPIPLLWQIKKTSKQIPLSELKHNLDINYREQENTDDWNLSPRTCLENPQKEKSHFQKIQKADLQFPIILYYYKKQWIILDGVYRFAKARKNKQNHILAKCLIFEDIQHLITNGEKPILLFEKTPFPFEKAVMQKCFSPTFLENFRKHHYFSAKLYKNFFLKHHYGLNETDLLQANQNHQRGSEFFSASYSGDRLFLALAKEKIGVDIEIIQERTPELLQKYTPELEKHFKKADWQHFYLLRTAKEAILKASNSKNLDLIDEITLLKTENASETIGTLKFDRKFIFTFQGQSYEVKSGNNAELARSICLNPKN